MDRLPGLQRDLDLLVDFVNVLFFFAVISETETQREMPGVGEAGRDVLGKLAELNQKAKEVKKMSERIKERKEKEKKVFVEEIDLERSDSVEVEELVHPTPSKFVQNIYKR